MIDDLRLRFAPSFQARAIIVTDVERRLPAAEKALFNAITHWDRGDTKPIILNRPTRPLRRYRLLKTLVKHGLQSGDIYRLDDPATLDLVKFPCFIRDENGHNIGLPVPRLLNTKDDLKQAIDALAKAGISLFGQVVVEYVDTTDDEGLHVKYSYFKIGSDILPAHRFVGRDWFVKGFDPVLASERSDLVDLERDFLTREPFKAEIADIFDLAGIDYGRIDFGVNKDKQLHVFEINTNPNHPTARSMAPTRQANILNVQDKLIGSFRALIKHQEPAQLHWPRNKGWLKSRQQTLRHLLEAQ